MISLRFGPWTRREDLRFTEPSVPTRDPDSPWDKLELF